MLIDIQQRVDTPRDCTGAQRLMGMAAECVVAHTAFRRVLVALFADPVVPGSSASRSRITQIASRGLDSQQKEALESFARKGGEVTGELYDPCARRGQSFLFDGQVVRPAASVRLPSSRRYDRGRGWRASDSLVVPFWSEGKILGHISVDDPLDGSLPSSRTLAWLEDLASVTAVALRDATKLQQMVERNRVLNALTERAIAGIILVEEGGIRYANQQACEVLGYESEELLQVAPWWQLVHPDDRPAFWEHSVNVPGIDGRARLVRRDGRIVWLALKSYPVEQDQPMSAMVVHFYDVTSHIQTESRLREQALHDPLTGLFNRAFFDEAIVTELERSKRYRRPMSLVIADLAKFKQVNDRLGHLEGDRVLAGVAGIIKDQLRDSDWVVRYGGDEFVLVLPETGDGVLVLERRLEAEVESWCQDQVPEVPLGIDFGWATWTPEEPLSISQLIQEADQMLYQRKGSRGWPESRRPREGLGQTPL